MARRRTDPPELLTLTLATVFEGVILWGLLWLVHREFPAVPSPGPLASVAGVALVNYVAGKARRILK